MRSCNLVQEKYSAKDLTKDILIFVVAAAVIIPIVALAPGLPLALKPFLKRKHYPSRINQTLRRLQNQKMISINEVNGKTRIEILDKGRKKVLSYEAPRLKPWYLLSTASQQKLLADRFAVKQHSSTAKAVVFCFC